MLKGFIDETQKHDGERFTGVGGFLFQQESLAGFQDEFTERTKGLEKPFHAAECYGPNDDKALLNDISRIVVHPPGCGFCLHRS